MNYIQLYKKTLLALLGAGVLILSCSKDLNKANESYPTLDSYFKNSTELAKGVAAIYSQMRGGALVSREWFFVQDLRSDDVASGGGQLEVPRNQMLNGATSADNALVGNVWNGLYSIIHRANTVILAAPDVTDNTAVRDRSVGEAKFLRAWAYFDLVVLWGAVPIYTTPVISAVDFQARGTVDAAYALIISDLQAAVAALPASYSGVDLGRVTKGAANALLGRVLMQKGDYAAAKTALLEVVNSGQYDINSVPYQNNFLEETEFNKESIFEVIYVENLNNSFNWGYQGDGGNNQSQGTTRNQEYSPIAWRNLIPSNKYLNEFETIATGATKTDPRFAMSVYQTGDTYNNGASVLTDADQNGNSSVVNGVTQKISWRKFMLNYKKPKGDFAGGGNNQRIIRYADVLLMLAECEAEAGTLPTAVGYLNQVRARPGVAMPPYPTTKFPTTTKNDVLKAVMHERTVELGDEEVRNRDILRWRKKGYYPSIVPEPLSYFRANHDELLPIPQQEISNNPKIPQSAQNAGY